MNEQVTGGCLCGAVRYQATVIENSAYYCHCRDCQIGSSSAFTTAIFSRQDQFKLLAGELTTYSKSADSGRTVNRLFCGQCGTPVCWTGDGFPEVVLLSLSSLDDPEAHQPVHEGWTDRALSWCRIRDNIESYPRRPERSEAIVTNKI